MILLSAHHSRYETLKLDGMYVSEPWKISVQYFRPNDVFNDSVVVCVNLQVRCCPYFDSA